MQFKQLIGSMAKISTELRGPDLLERLKFIHCIPVLDLYRIYTCAFITHQLKKRRTTQSLSFNNKIECKVPCDTVITTFVYM